VALYQRHLEDQEDWTRQRGLIDAQDAHLNQSLPGPVVPTLTDKDTLLSPSPYIGSLAIYFSPWIDLCSDDPVISSISRQVLNLEAAYANFCGARTIVIPGPRQDDSSRGIAQYARAIREALQVANRANVIIHMPMYREPGLEEKAETLTSLFGRKGQQGPEAAAAKKEIDLFGAWDSWNTIRSVCNYSMRLFVGRFSIVLGRRGGPVTASRY
jgi:protein arginine N-methyltransferase 5